ncbi:MAG: HK97 family phage prohead protease [Acidimicrobiia bacterium]
MSDIERRYTLLMVETRARGDDRRTIGGYAAKFNQVSQNLGGFVEQVLPSFFNKSRGDGWPGVMARYNHNNDMLLGTVEGGTLRLTIDSTGLAYEVDLPATRSDVFELVERRDVSKSSFGFRRMTVEDDWGMSDQGYPLRSLISAQMVDVAPVTDPAYLDTTAALRSLAEKMSADLDEVRSLAEQNELRKFFVRTDGPQPKSKVFGPAALLELKAKQEPAA